jgi:hypothetical protein
MISSSMKRMGNFSSIGQFLFWAFFKFIEVAQLVGLRTFFNGKSY